MRSVGIQPAGVPLRLRMRVLNDYFCRPGAGAKVEIWQSDAGGLYSGVENVPFDMRTMEMLPQQIVDLRGKEFLRGQNHYDSFILSGVSGRGARAFYYPPLAQSRCAVLVLGGLVRSVHAEDELLDAHVDVELDLVVEVTLPRPRRLENLNTPEFGDSAVVPRGIGTFASRSVAMGGSAIVMFDTLGGSPATGGDLMPPAKSRVIQRGTRIWLLRNPVWCSSGSTAL